MLIIPRTIKFKLALRAFLFAILIHFVVLFSYSVLFGDPIVGLIGSLMFGLWLGTAPSLLLLVTVVPMIFFLVKRGATIFQLYFAGIVSSICMSSFWGILNGIEKIDLDAVYPHLSYYLLSSVVLVKLISNKFKNEDASEAGTDAAKTRRPF